MRITEIQIFFFFSSKLTCTIDESLEQSQQYTGNYESDQKELTKESKR